MHSQGIRRCGLRHSRYMGLAKIHSHHLATAADLTFVRLGECLTGTLRVKTRGSPFAALKEVFTELDRFMYDRAQRYIKRRHPRKSGWWRTQKYWGQTLGRQDRWVFQDKPRHGTLRKFAWTKII